MNCGQIIDPTVVSTKKVDAESYKTFDWTDPFFLEGQLSEEECLIRDSAKAYAQGELQPRIIDAYESHDHASIPG